MSTEKEQAEIRLIEAEAAKYEAETESYVRQRSKSALRWERLKALTGLTGIVTAFIAVVGVILSIAEFQREEVRAREAQTVKQLNDSILLLADTSLSKRLAGIASLESFFPKEHIRVDKKPTTEQYANADVSAKQKQILTLLLNMLAIEKDQSVRDSILMTLRNLKLEGLDPALKTNILTQLVGMSNSLVETGHLNKAFDADHLDYIEKRISEETEKKGIDEITLSKLKNERRKLQALKDMQEAIEPRAKSVSEAIALLIYAKTKADNLEGIFCAGCDFRNLQLDGVNLSNALLSNANFSGASLSRAKFNGADLSGTVFRNANLSDAEFRSSKDREKTFSRSNYIEKRQTDTHLQGPNFNCANLQNADFSGHPIFGFVHENVSKYTISSASFIGADLKGTNFFSAQAYVTTTQEQKMPFDFEFYNSPAPINSYVPEGAFRTIGKFDNKPDMFGLKRTLSFELHSFLRALSGSNWKDAKLPPEIKTLLNTYNPRSGMDFYEFEPRCNPPSSRKVPVPSLSISLSDSVSKLEIESAFADNDINFIIDALSWKLGAKSNSGAVLSEDEELLRKLTSLYYVTNQVIDTNNQKFNLMLFIYTSALKDRPSNFDQLVSDAMFPLTLENLIEEYKRPREDNYAPSLEDVLSKFDMTENELHKKLEAKHSEIKTAILTHSVDKKNIILELFE